MPGVSIVPVLCGLENGIHGGPDCREGNTGTERVVGLMDDLTRNIEMTLFVAEKTG